MDLFALKDLASSIPVVVYNMCSVQAISKFRLRMSLVEVMRAFNTARVDVGYKGVDF